MRNKKLQTVLEVAGILLSGTVMGYLLTLSGSENVRNWLAKWMITILMLSAYYIGRTFNNGGK
jgi:hypothetical protein